MTTNTVRLHRVLRTIPEKVYKAFLNPEALVKWLPPHGFTAKVHQLDAKVGGQHRMSFTNFSTGNTHFFGGTYLELVEDSGAGETFADVAELQGVMRRIVADPERRAAMASAAYSRFRSFYSEEAVVPQYLALVQRLLRRGAPAPVLPERDAPVLA